MTKQSIFFVYSLHEVTIYVYFLNLFEYYSQHDDNLSIFYMTFLQLFYTVVGQLLMLKELFNVHEVFTAVTNIR